MDAINFENSPNTNFYKKTANLVRSMYSPGLEVRIVAGWTNGECMVLFTRGVAMEGMGITAEAPRR